MISTKGINVENNVGGVPKSLQPGNNVCKILSVTLEKDRFKDEAYNLVLNMESQDLGEGFDGFFIDKNDPSLGKYKGQVGKVRSSEYSYSDGETKSGIQIYRDKEILKMVATICKETDSTAWLEAQDNQHNTIESLVEQLNDDRPFAGKLVNVCLGGREYQNASGYTSYDLFMPKSTKIGVSMEKHDSKTASNRVHVYNPDLHIRRKKVTTVESFAADTSTAGSSFDLD